MPFTPRLRRAGARRGAGDGTWVGPERLWAAVSPPVGGHRGPALRLKRKDRLRLSLARDWGIPARYPAGMHPLYDLSEDYPLRTPLAPAEPGDSNQTRRTPVGCGLTEHEERIADAIKSRSERGAEYARGLSASGARTPTAWQKKGCPPEYLNAYDEPRWRKRIQGERKAVQGKMATGAMPGYRRGRRGGRPLATLRGTTVPTLTKKDFRNLRDRLVSSGQIKRAAATPAAAVPSR